MDKGTAEKISEFQVGIEPMTSAMLVRSSNLLQEFLVS